MTDKIDIAPSTSESYTSPLDFIYKVHREYENAMLVPDHFVFPPHEHENLPLGDSDEIYYQDGVQMLATADDLQNYFDEFNEESLEEQHFIPSIEFQGLDTEICSRQMIPFDDENDNTVAFDFSDIHYDIPTDFLNIEKNSGSQDGGSGFTGEAWWRRHAASLRKQVKETNTFWSIFMAAALMGLVVMGQRWKRDKLQIQQLKLQFSITNERLNRMLGSIHRFKAVLVGGHQRSPMIHGVAAAHL